MDVEASNVTNGTHPTSSLHPSFFKTYTHVAVVLYSVIIVLGTVTNSLVIFTVARWPSMRTSCNVLLMNIAVADVLVALIAAPLRIVELRVGWPLGKAMCYLLRPLQEAFVVASVVTHTAIAIERYRLIVTPHKPKLTLRQTALIICAIWVLTYLTSALPYAVHLKHSDGTDCYAVWPSDLYRRVFCVYLVVFFIAVPLGVQAFAYWKLLMSMKLRSTVRSNSVVYGKQAARRTNQLLKTLIALVVTFQVCYIPRGVMMILLEFDALPESLATEYVDLIALILFYVKHIVNPFILFASSSEFRSHYNIQICRALSARKNASNSVASAPVKVIHL